jgi:hypothetical protein
MQRPTRAVAAIGDHIPHHARAIANHHHLASSRDHQMLVLVRVKCGWDNNAQRGVSTSLSYY